MNPKYDVKFIEDECALALAPLNIEMKAGIGTIPINGDFFGWIGLNVGHHKNFIRINPFIGVHCPPIMKLTATAGGKKYRPKEIATFAVFLGSLCPHVEQFIFTDETDIRVEAERLSSIVDEFGIPYIKKIANYPVLISLLEARISSLGGYPQRYAAALYLSGNSQRAVDFIDNEIVLLKDDNETDVITALENLRKLMRAN